MSTAVLRIEAAAGQARSGVLTTRRGAIRTPAFMPVGTAGTVKALYPEQVAASGADILLGNTYHLMLRPGAERLARLGGLHRFMNWPRPILTDSGGFQVMSLGALRRIDDDGVTFRSHLDGSSHRLTPERAMAIQALIGADIRMQLDECIALPATHEATERAMHRSLAWATRSRAAFEAGGPDGALCFGIVQGGTDARLRLASAEALTGMGFDGLAVGGLAVGEGQRAMFDVLDATTPHLPWQQPRYLMGVGTPSDIVGAVARGIDMFDCVMPTRAGRHGQAFTWAGRLNLKNAQFAEDDTALDPHSAWPGARLYSRAYLHHLVRAGEYLGAMLLSWQNLHFYQELMAAIRAGIHDGGFTALAARVAAVYPERRETAPPLGAATNG